MPEKTFRILAAMAHPDDVEYSCTATVANDNSYRVSVTMSDGSIVEVHLDSSINFQVATPIREPSRGNSHCLAVTRASSSSVAHIALMTSENSAILQTPP